MKSKFYRNFYKFQEFKCRKNWKYLSKRCFAGDRLFFNKMSKGWFL